MKPPVSSEIFGSLHDFCRSALKVKSQFCIGKGHTIPIQISKIPDQKFILIDYLTSSSGDYYGIANNDINSEIKS